MSLEAASSSYLLRSSSNRAYGGSWFVKTAQNVELWALFFQCRSVFSMQSLSCHQWLIDTKHPITCKNYMSQQVNWFSFYWKQPPPRIFCALSPIVPMTRQHCERYRSLVSVFSMQSRLPSVTDRQKTSKNIKKLDVITSQLISFSTRSNLLLVSSVLLLQSCLHGASWCVKTARNVDLWSLFFSAGSLAISEWTSQTACHNKSTDFHFYCKQPPPRIFCAPPPIVPTWCVKVRQNREKCGSLVSIVQCRVSWRQRLIDTKHPKTSKIYVITCQLI